MQPPINNLSASNVFPTTIHFWNGPQITFTTVVMVNTDKIFCYNIDRKKGIKYIKEAYFLFTLSLNSC